MIQTILNSETRLLKPYGKPKAIGYTFQLRDIIGPSGGVIPQPPEGSGGNPTIPSNNQDPFYPYKPYYPPSTNPGPGSSGPIIEGSGED